MHHRVLGDLLKVMEKTKQIEVELVWLKDQYFCDEEDCDGYCWWDGENGCQFDSDSAQICDWIGSDISTCLEYPYCSHL